MPRFELIEAEKQKKDIRKIVLPSHNSGSKSGGEDGEKKKLSGGSSPAKAKVKDETSKSEGSSPKNKPEAKTTTSAHEDLLGLGLGTAMSASAGEADILGLGG